MPTRRITLRPGINKQATPTQNEGGWSDANLVGFRDGQPEKWKGWQNAAAGETYVGTARALRSWATLAGIETAAIGTHLKLHIFQGGNYADVTPVRETGQLTDPFTTVNSSPVVTVADTNHGLLDGDFAIFDNAVAVGGITIDGEYTVTVIDANSYTITHNVAASSTAGPGGGTVDYTYLIHIGTQDATPGTGWGAGEWGEGTWGTPRNVSATTLLPGLWSFDLIGEDLAACPRDGAIYRWDASVGVGTRAAILAGAPTINKCILMGLPERHLIAFGADVGAVQDPMLIRWSDVEDFIDWTATATNSAGSFRIHDGTQIVRALSGTGEMLILTDTSLHSMRFSGTPFFYRFDKRGTACGLMAPNAAIVYNGIAYWMGANRQFYRYRGGAPEVLPCTVWDEVFEDINILQAGKITCGLNPGANKVIWFYPSANSVENDRYAALNLFEGTWERGILVRTAWDDGSVFGFPIATDSSNRMFYHEFSEDDDGQPMSWFIESGRFDLEDGENMILLSDLFPDFKMSAGGQVSLTMKYYETPDSETPWETVGPALVSAGSKFVSLEGRGKQAAIRIEGNKLGLGWRMGAPRAVMQPDGRQ